LLLSTGGAGPCPGGHPKGTLTMAEEYPTNPAWEARGKERTRRSGGGVDEPYRLG
jgi:hypothetical protein